MNSTAHVALLKLCKQLTEMRKRLRQIPGEGQSESYFVADDVICYVQEALAQIVEAPMPESFRIAFLKWNGIHTDAEIKNEWESYGALCSTFFREGYEAGLKARSAAA